MDSYRRALLNSFTAGCLDRYAERRGDTQWLAARRRDPASLFVMVRGGDCLVDVDADGGGAAVFLNHEQVGEADAVFLGCRDGAAVFAVDGGDRDIDAGGDFIDLRAAAGRLRAEHASLLAYAKSLIHWRRAHRRCPACGAPAHSESGGHVLRCGGCGRAQFPRTDPAVIVLVEHAGACLLARQPGWERQRYSVLAGFVEPGESAEQTVVREVREEAGVTVTRLRYHASQPWPFPGSLMLGYFAKARDARIRVDGDELEHARWFTRAEMVRQLERKQLRLSPAISISHRLIEHWFDAGGKTPLREVLARCGS